MIATLVALVALAVAVIFSENVVIAPLSAAISALGAYFAFRAVQQGKDAKEQATQAKDNIATTNGHTAGEILEDLRDDMALIKVWVVEHLREHENERRR